MTGWRMPVREVRAAVGAGYVYAICGEMRTMPGLPKRPAAERIDIDEDGNVVVCPEPPVTQLSDCSIISDFDAGAVPSPKGRPPSC